MDLFTEDELREAHQAVASMISKCEKAQEKLPSGTSQHTLLINRIKALCISQTLIEKELGELQQ